MLWGDLTAWRDIYYLPLHRLPGLQLFSWYALEERQGACWAEKRGWHHVCAAASEIVTATTSLHPELPTILLHSNLQLDFFSKK